MIKIKQICEKGHMSTSEFIKLAQFKPVHKTHCLDVGDYLVTPSIMREGFDIEKIENLEYLGEHDFRTVKGTTGPIEGNLFIKLDKRGDYRIIEGDMPYLGNGSVYQVIRQLLETSRTNQN